MRSYENHVQNAQELIDHNRYMLYHLPSKYENLTRVLKHEGIRQLVLSVYRFLKDKQVIAYKNMYVFYLTNEQITKLRSRTTADTSSRYMNYICSVGLFRKIYQHLDLFGDIEETELTNINFSMLQKADYGKLPMNFYRLKIYDNKELEILERRSERLLSKNIKPGNISAIMLRANECEDIADEVYPHNNKKAINRKIYHYEQITATIDKIIAEKGYTTKMELLENMRISEKNFNKALKVYKNDFNQKYDYKAPGRKDKELFNITNNKWIIKKKETYNAKKEN